MQQLQSQRVSLQHILDAKERRAHMQAELRSCYRASVVSITVNMPGNVKYNDDTVTLVYKALDAVRTSIKNSGFILLEERIYYCFTGPAALIAVSGDASKLKSAAVSIEEEHAYSRLLDIDVFDESGQQINRKNQGLPSRRCLVCAETAVNCMRAQRHSPEEVLKVVREMILQHRAEQAGSLPKEVEIIAGAALEAMLFEAACAPAPGLVDRFNSGAHDDMDIFTFIRSSRALVPAMERCAIAAWNHSGPREELLPILRYIGTGAEKAMFVATEGINTQKGLLFLLGIVVAAAALAVKEHRGNLSVENILANVAGICSGIVASDLEILKIQLPSRQLSAGERLYLSYGTLGIRGEVEKGLPSVAAVGLPTLHDALSKGHSLNDALIQTLLSLMAETEDTTILNRHDYAVLKSVQLDAKHLMKLGGMVTEAGRREIALLDQSYAMRRISPGGSADLLAVTYFLYAIEKSLKV